MEPCRYRVELVGQLEEKEKERDGGWLYPSTEDF